MKNIFKIIFVIIGTMIGAGFASGQEMYLFFFSHGMIGVIGILISGGVIGYVIYKTLRIVDEYGISNYKEFLSVIMPKHEKVRSIANIVITIFILITFFIMIAGFGAYFEQELNISKLIGSTILAGVTFLVFMTNVRGFVKANEILVPILIMFLILVGIINIKSLNFQELDNYVINTNKSNFILDAILYGSYNSILLIPVLVTLKNYLKNKKEIIKISLISVGIIIILSTIIFLLLVKVDVNIELLEMPAVYVVSNISKIFQYIYGFIILGSIFTTAISLGTSFLQNVAHNRKSYTQIAIIMCITSIIISNVGFSKLVELLYPIFGYLGAIQILKLITVKMTYK